MKRMLIAGAALLLVTVMNGQDTPTTTDRADPTAAKYVPSTKVLEHLSADLALNEAQLTKAKDLLMRADQESAEARKMCEEMMKRVDAIYEKFTNDLAADLSPEQSKKFTEMKAQGALSGVCCAGSKGCSSAAATGKKDGCCAGGAAAPGKAMTAPRPTIPAER